MPNDKTEKRYYSNATVIVDPSAFEGRPMEVPAAPERKPIDGVNGLSAWKHVDPANLQIDVDSVAWQLSHDDRRPSMAVTVEDLTSAHPNIAYPLKDARDSKQSGGESGGGSGGSSDGSTFAAKHHVSDDPNEWNYDGDKNGKPDVLQWTTV